MQDHGIFLQRGTENAIKISSDSINVERLRFTQTSSPKIPDRIGINISFKNTNKDFSDLDTTMEIITSSSLRN